MLKAAIAFFVLALVSIIFGMNGVAGLSMDAGRLLLGVFLVLAVISFLVNLLGGKRTPLP